jgi:glucose-6-phosphate dehydrogenase assembly protein OpcA
MPTTYKVLGQVAPSATTLTTLDTVPSATSAVVSTIAVCNRAATAATYRIAIRPAGAAIANEHYIAYDSTVAANDTTMLTIGITLAATDVISVYASTANLSFNAFGSEIS